MQRSVCSDAVFFQIPTAYISHKITSELFRYAKAVHILPAVHDHPANYSASSGGERMAHSVQLNLQRGHRQAGYSYAEWKLTRA